MTFNLYEAMGQATIDRPPPTHTVDDIVKAGRSLRRRRRRLKVAMCTAAAVVAVAATATVVLPTTASTHAPAAPASASAQSWPDLDPFEISFKGYDLGELHVSDPMLVTPGYQQSAVYLDGVTQRADDAVYPSPVATLTVFRPGVFNPEKYQRGEKIQSGGRTGLAISNTVTVEGQRPPVIGPSGKPMTQTRAPRNEQRPAVAWQYTDNAWATLVARSSLPETQSAQSLFALAGGLRPTAPSTPKVPFQMRYIPPGFHLVAVGAESPYSSYKDSISALYFAKGNVSFTNLTDPYNPDELAKTFFRVSVYPTPKSAQADPANANHPNSARPCDGGTFCDKPINAKYYAEVSDLGNADELAKIINALTFDDIADPSTWHDPTTSGALR